MLLDANAPAIFDLPIPASPLSTTTCPEPTHASAHRAASEAISGSRPITVLLSDDSVLG